jgi:hypothetical protein
MTRRSSLLGSIQPPASKSLQRASPPCLKTRPPKTLDDPEKGTLNKPSSSSRAMVVPALSVAVLRMTLTSPEARQTSRGSPVQGRSCLGDRGTVRRAAHREPKASLDRTLSGPAGGLRGLAQWDSRISVRKQRLRSPAPSGDSMDLSWRGASISQFQKAYAGNISGPSSTTRPRRPATSSTSRSSPIVELRCDRVASSQIEWPHRVATRAGDEPCCI